MPEPPQNASNAARKEQAGQQATQRYIAIIAGGVIVAGLYLGRPILVPLALAVLLAFIISPLVDRLQRLGLGRVVPVIMSVTVFLSIIGGIGSIVGQQGAHLAENLPDYQQRLSQKLEGVQAILPKMNFRSVVAEINSVQTGVSQTAAPPHERGRQPQLVKLVADEPGPWELFTGVLWPLWDPLSLVGLVFIFAVFILLQKDDLRDRFVRLVGSRGILQTKNAIDDGASRLSRYLVAQFVVNTGFGVVIGTGLWLFGIPSPVLWALLFGVMRFVPYVGVPIAAVLPLILALAVGTDWSLLLQVGAMILGAELLVGQVIEPLLYGRSTGISTVAVVVSATFWAWLWGPVGLIVSTPLTMCLVVIGRHVEHLRFLHILLSDEPALSPEQALYMRLLTEGLDDEAAQAEAFLENNSLEAFGDTVALKALELVQKDASRGALEHRRATKLRDAVLALLEGLDKKLGSPADADATAPPAVLCVATKSVVDESAGHLLAYVLRRRGVATAVAAGPARIGGADLSGAKVICLCFGDVRMLSNSSSLIRRVKQQFGDAAIVVWAWSRLVGEAPDLNGLAESGYDVVRSMEDAAARISALVRGPPAEPAPPLEQQPASLAG